MLRMLRPQMLNGRAQTRLWRAAIWRAINQTLASSDLGVPMLRMLRPQMLNGLKPDSGEQGFGGAYAQNAEAPNAQW
ncbi:hypothetical protein VNO80_10176 [Phaseolus coccineus]|uniref:Uncharacterized protein n=1 Tax=Phaseolus coccineus TaxID=3886 RepID=A0AAN9NE20_PHACN